MQDWRLPFDELRIGSGVDNALDGYVSVRKCMDRVRERGVVTWMSLTRSMSVAHAQWDSSMAVTKGNKQSRLRSQTRSRALATEKQKAPDEAIRKQKGL